MQSNTDMTTWRGRIELFINHPTVQHLLVFLIVINAAILGIETSPSAMESWGEELFLLDHAILAVFIAEILLLIAARGLSFFKDAWCVFDFIVVGIALVPASGSLSVLRALRVLRVLRLINKVESMRKVVGGLLGSLPGLGSVFGLIMIIFYVASVIATDLFHKDFPDWFGDLGTSAFTLFQIMTLESWADGIARPVMESFPYAWVFFILFILIATFVIFNLFIAVIVDSITADKEKDHRDHLHQNSVQEELQHLRREMAELRQLLTKQNQ
ncbi:MAG: ion transporter [Limnohabitans sp.]|nr:ion transporter [Limnohabitans sp.]